MRLSLPADVSRPGRARSRLAHARIQAKIADQLGRAREMRDVSDHRGHSHCRDQAYAWDGHQVHHPAIRKGGLRDALFGQSNLGFYRAQQAESTVDLMALLRGQWNPSEPLATRLAKDIGEGMIDEVAVQHGMDAISQSRLLLYQRLVMSYLMPQRPCGGVRRPYRGDKVRGEQLRQDRAVDPVRLDLGAS
jgi:hypothetical protein